jgi:ABC-type multidrug transport system fused ATPase/permease subunit
MDPLSSRNQSTVGSYGGERKLVSSIVWLSIAGGTASFVRTYLINAAQGRIAARLRKEAFASLLTKKEIEWFQLYGSEDVPISEEEKTVVTIGEMKTPANQKEEKSISNFDRTSTTTSGMSPAAIGVILKDDVDMVAATVTNTVANLLRSTSSFVFGTYNMLCINPQLVGLSLAVAPIVGTVAWMSRKYLKKVEAIQQQAAINTAAFLEERLNHIMIVKMSNREHDEVQTYNEMEDEYVSLGSKAAFASGMSMGVMFAMGSTALCGILLAGRQAVKANQMSSGQLTSFGTYSFMLALGSAGIVRALSEYSRGITSAVRLYKLIHCDDDDQGNNGNASHASLDASTIKGQQPVVDMVKDVQRTSIENVSFSYKTNQTKVILKNISLSLSRGEVVVLVGKNGAGKSTIVSLLSGLYSPTSGSITLYTSGDEQSIDYTTDIDRSTQARLIQVVPQSPALFNMSILENVRYSRPDASQEDVMNAMTSANCNGFLSSLEGGMDYQVGRNGTRLSGGQKQRLGLARAFLADPVFLVLDEPVSSMDTEGENAVKDTLDACRTSDKGLLVITHRAKTLEFADRIVVLKDGEIVEQGTLAKLQKDKSSALMTLMPDLE